jgi:RNA polymerase sigma-70 factor (ECF subfamily)
MITPGLSFELFGDEFARQEGWSLDVDKAASSGSAEGDLIRECLQGRREACRTLFQRIHPAVIPICTRFTSSEEEAMELLKAGAALLFRRLPEYRGDVTFQEWAEQLMLQLAIDRFHALADSAKEQSMEELDSGYAYALGFTPEEVFARVEPDALLLATRELSPVLRMVFNLAVMHGWSHDRIARELRISAGSSRAGLNRARMRLTDHLIKRDPSLLSKPQGHGG